MQRNNNTKLKGWKGDEKNIQWRIIENEQKIRKKETRIKMNGQKNVR